MSTSTTSAPPIAVISCVHCAQECSSSSQYCPACGFPLAKASNKADDPFIGTILPAGYHILELIGVGGMGRVYRAEQKVLGRTVAVKVIHPHLLADESSALRFLTEARASSQLNHPNSISVFDFGRTDEGHPYLVMELLRGRDLSQVIHETGAAPVKQIVDVLTQVLAALGEAHELGIIHRDLKPDNIILQPLRRGGELVKVLDFGLAKLKADAPGKGVTNPGIVCGTPDYMAPEQGRGDETDGRSDLYAVGVILFQLLTGRLPFEGDSPTQVVMMHLTVPAPDPRQIAPELKITAVMAEVLKKALAKKITERFQDAHEFSQALRQTLENNQLSSSQESSIGLAPSLVVHQTAHCEACGYSVPQARYCCECSAPLTSPGALEFPLPLIGRSDDLAWLHSRRPKENKILGARIVGPAGIGKTRLLEEFTKSVTAQGDRVIIVEPDHYAARVAHFGLKKTISALARLKPGAEDFSSATGAAYNGLVDIFSGVSRGDTRAPMERRHCLLQALKWALLDAAKRESGMPVILIDGMKRLDGPSAHAFADLFGDPPKVAALFVAAHSPGFESGWGAQHTSARILEELNRVEVQGQIGSAKALSSGEGILPLYLDQALRYQSECAQEPPERLGDLIAQRLEMLDAQPRLLLQGVAILGMGARVSDVAELIQADGVDEPLRQLTEAGMLTLSNNRATFSHPLIRHIALAGTPNEARRKLHLRALKIEESKRAPLEVRALHAFEASQSFQALLLLEQVADRATTIGDARAEVSALRRGLEVARREISRGELDDPMRAVLIFSRKLGASLTRAGNFGDADGVLLEAVELAGPTSPDRAKIYGALAHVSYGRKRYDEALTRLRKGIEIAHKANAKALVSSLEDTQNAWTR